jgi:hypothetical protein
MSSAMQSNSEPSLAGKEQSPHMEATSACVREIAPVIAKSQAAFRRDLPELLKSRFRWWVAYHGDERIRFGKTQRELYRECFRRGLKEGEFVVCSIEPDAAIEEPEVEITPWA